MNTFDIKEQHRLPMSKCVELVLSGIQFRLFRASVTVAIVTLAVAFLMTILGDSFISREVSHSLPTLTQPRRVMVFWVQRLSRAITEPDLMFTIQAAKAGDARWVEIRSWSAGDDAALAELQSVAEKEDQYLRWFADLKEGQLRRLAGRARGREILQALQEPAAMTSFAEELPGIGKQIPGSLAEFQDLLRRWAATAALRQKIIEGQFRAVDEVKKTLFAGRSVNEYLAAMDPAAMEKLNALGFRMTPQEIPVVRENAQERLKARTMERVLRNTVLKQKFANHYGIKDINKVTSDLLFDKMRSRKDAQWLLDTRKELATARKEILDAEKETAARLKMSVDEFRGTSDGRAAQVRLADIESALEALSELKLTVDEIVATSESRVRQLRLADIESAVDALNRQGGISGFPPRVLWLIAVSLIVCVVGIANAMLMSVTERFKEIATMKCLGSTDGFIMVNFILESGFQGLAGGVIGSVLGLILGVLRASLTYGVLAFQNIPLLDTLILVVVSIAAGVILSVVAAIYPAYVAARLAPMEAMRVE